MWEMEWATPSIFAEPSGDACDHYHRFPEDIALLAELGCNAYRFGVEWARIEPDAGYFSRAELDHYRRMCATCLEHGITPVVTSNHFSSPRWFAATAVGSRTRRQPVRAHGEALGPLARRGGPGELWTADDASV